MPPYPPTSSPPTYLDHELPLELLRLSSPVSSLLPLLSPESTAVCSAKTNQAGGYACRRRLFSSSGSRRPHRPRPQQGVGGGRGRWYHWATRQAVHLGDRWEGHRPQDGGSVGRHAVYSFFCQKCFFFLKAVAYLFSPYFAIFEVELWNFSQLCLDFSRPSLLRLLCLGWRGDSPIPSLACLSYLLL